MLLRRVVSMFRSTLAHEGARESSREIGRWWETMTRQRRGDIKLVCA